MAFDADDVPMFRPLGAAEEPTHDAAPSESRAGYRVYRGADGFEAALPEPVIGRAVLVGRRAAPREWYGLVVGRLFLYQGRSHVVVDGFVPDPDARAELTTVQTTPESEFETRETARRLFPDGIILGWIHGHPRYGIRFSSTDKRNQATWTQPHSLGIVVDPWHPEEISVYRGPRSELLARAGSSSAPPIPARHRDPALTLPPIPRSAKLPDHARPSRPRRLLDRAAPWFAAVALASSISAVLVAGRLAGQVERLAQAVKAPPDETPSRLPALPSGVAPGSASSSPGDDPAAPELSCRAQEPDPPAPPGPICREPESPAP